MNAEALIMRINDKNKTDDDWLKLHADILEFLQLDPDPEDRKKFVPLGYLEVVSMMCDGILRKRGPL